MSKSNGLYDTPKEAGRHLIRESTFILLNHKYSITVDRDGVLFFSGAADYSAPAPGIVRSVQDGSSGEGGPLWPVKVQNKTAIYDYGY